MVAPPDSREEQGFYQRQLLPLLIHLAMSARVLREYRQRIVRQAQGVVLELGFGSGLNLPFYDPSRVRCLVALEPDRHLLALARERINRAPFPVEMLQEKAEKMPLPTASIDTVVSTWTLCTIPAIDRALAEVRRVLKPDGRILFVEHGLSPEPGVAHWQHRLTPAWKRLAGGCHLNRNTDELLRAAGFQVIRLETGYLGPLNIMTYMYEGGAAPAPWF